MHEYRFETFEVVDISNVFTCSSDVIDMMFVGIRAVSTHELLCRDLFKALPKRNLDFKDCESEPYRKALR